VVSLWRPKAIDAGDAGNDDDIVSLKERPGGGVAHLIDLFIDLRVLLDIRIGGGDIGFGLIVIVITDEEFDRILRKEVFEFAVKLGGQGLVVRDDQRGLLDPLDHIGHGEGLSGAGHS